MLQALFLRTARRLNTVECNYDIFSQFLFNSWQQKIYDLHLNRNVKQQNPYPLNVPETFIGTKSINESFLTTNPPHPRPKLSEACFFSDSFKMQGYISRRTELLIITQLSSYISQPGYKVRSEANYTHFAIHYHVEINKSMSIAIVISKYRINLTARLGACRLNQLITH